VLPELDAGRLLLAPPLLLLLRVLAAGALLDGPLLVLALLSDVACFLLPGLGFKVSTAASSGGVCLPLMGTCRICTISSRCSFCLSVSFCKYMAWRGNS
jgi:hypothetical protein